MSAALIGALRVTLGLDSASFEEGAKKAAASSNRLRKDIKNDFTSLQREISGISATLTAGLAGFIGGFAVAGIQDAIKGGLEYASSLAEVAQQLGVTTKTLQEYRYVASQVGVSQDELDAGLQRLTRSIGAAGNGSKQQTAAFAALGVSVRDANGNLRSTDEILPQLIQSFSSIANPAERARLEVALFGKAGQQLDTLLAGGIAQVDNLKRAADELGVVLSEDAIKNADDTADKLAALQQVLRANISNAVAQNAGTIYDLANAMTYLAEIAIKAAAKVGEFYRSARLKAGGAPGFANDLLKSSDGRRSLLSEIDERISQNRSDRAGGRGNRQSYLYGTISVTGPADAASNKRLDDQLKSLVQQRAIVLEAERRAAAAPAARGGFAGGGGAGGSVRRSRRVGGSARPRGRSDPGEQDARDLQSLLDRVFPDQALFDQLQTNIATINKALAAQKIDAGSAAEAIGRLRAAYSDTVAKTGDEALKALDEASPVESTQNAVERLTKDLDRQYGLVKKSNGELVRSFEDTAQSIANSLSNLSGSIRGGDFLDILGSLVGVATQLGGAGVFGKKIQTSINGARAYGGPVLPGNTYLVGERGPELFRPSGAGSIVPSGQSGAGGTGLTVSVVKGDLFDVIVQGHVSDGIRVAAPAITANSAVAANDLQRRQQRRRLA